jgi:trehalose/maltose hydrolase-like predicted phosphorylase/beta-phosphoglucomutase-like phosphatase (HAD superfamily)
VTGLEFEGVILDLDRVVVDTDAVAGAVRNHLSAERSQGARLREISAAPPPVESAGQIFQRELIEHGVRTFRDARDLLRRLRERGVHTAYLTTRPVAEPVLRAAGLLDAFTGGVDGSGAGAVAGPGDGERALLQAALGRLSLDPGNVAVILGSEAGVAAARSIGFGLVIGVHRWGSGEALRLAGADLTVTDLQQTEAHLGIRSPLWAGGASVTDPLLLRYTEFLPEQEGVRESLCTLGSGYWATRGASPEAVADSVHYPGTYLAGVYDRMNDGLEPAGGEAHLVNSPNWLPLRFATEGSPWFSLSDSDLLSYEQELDLSRSILTRTLRYRDHANRVTRVSSRRFMSMADTQTAVLVTEFSAENWAGALTICSELDGRVVNRNPDLWEPRLDRHLLPRQARRIDDESILLEMETSRSGIRIALAARTRAWRDGRTVPLDRTLGQEHDRIGHTFQVRVDPDSPFRVEKVVSVATSRDRAIDSPDSAVCTRIRRLADAPRLQEEHERSWRELWDDFAVSVRPVGRESLALNLDTFHVLQTVAGLDPDLDGGLPARGLHGEGYRGHVFWDEAFAYPMLTLRRPDLSRALLGYRYRRLDEARAAARAAGRAGAMFPWQSAADGSDETPARLYNPLRQGWMLDHSGRQRHVGLAIAYSAWRYYEATGDTDYLRTQGAELILEIARFFVSLSRYDAGTDRYDIDGVMGPDEFHDGPPSAPGSGLRNNAYTNVMTAWLLRRVGRVVSLLEPRVAHHLLTSLGLVEEDLEQWAKVGMRLRVPFLPGGIISQFEGYGSLAEFDWGAYRARYGDIHRLDLILDAEGDSTNRYRVSKQADVLMLLYLLSTEELRDILQPMGYSFPPEAVAAAVNHYAPRSTHGSTLSEVVHAWVEVRRNRVRSWHHAMRAFESDMTGDRDRGTRDGVHIGAMAGSVDLVIRCYTGLEVRDEMLWLNPVLPPALDEIAFSIVYRGQPIRVEVYRTVMHVRLDAGHDSPTTLVAAGRRTTLAPGDHATFPLKASERAGMGLSTLGTRHEDGDSENQRPFFRSDRGS